MRITDAFLGEHAVFYAQFAHLEATIPQAECRGQVRYQTQLLAAALASHAHLEDELLFLPLESYLDTQTGPLAVMRAEHDAIEQGLEHIPNIQDLDEARTTLLNTIRLAREHFAKEERILYPMAHQFLSEDTLNQSAADWARNRSVVCAE